MIAKMDLRSLNLYWFKNPFFCMGTVKLDRQESFDTASATVPKVKMAPKSPNIF